jgi:HEAT repeat protein/beta-lactamase regulating signal transducer with metallopeptidase domain
MTHFIDTVLEVAVGILADWSLRWAVLIGLLGAGLAVFRPRRTATRYLACLAVLVAGLLVPVVPRWGPELDFPAPVPPPAPDSTELLPPKLPSPSPAPDAAPVPALPAAGRALSPDRPAAESPIPPAAEPVGARRMLILVVAGLWAMGVCISLARRLGGGWLLARVRREAVAVEGDPVFEDCRAAFGMRRAVQLATHPAVRSPLTAGLFRPVILVPPDWPDLPEPARRSIALHELAHLACRDDWLAGALELVRTVFFFHPFVRWLLNRLERERELLCDEATVARGVDPREYARLLLEFARQPGRLFPTALGIGLGSRRTVKARIHQLLEGDMNLSRSPLSRRRTAVLAAAAALMALGLGSLRVLAIAAGPPSDAPRADEKEKVVPDDRNPQPADRPAGPRARPTAPDRKTTLRYGGKGFEQWREELATELKPETRIEGIKALSAFGANSYGEEAAKAILEVIRGYDVTLNNSDDNRVIGAAVEGLAKIGPEAQAALLAELKEGKRNGRRFVVTFFEGAGVSDRAAVPALLAAMKDEDPYVRQTALEAVRRTDPNAKGFVATLAGLVKDEDRHVRQLAITRLGEMEGRAKAAVPALVEALKDADPETRTAAANTLGRIGPEAKAAIPALLNALADEQGQVCKSAIAALESIKPDAKSVVPALAGLLKDERVDVRRTARGYLGNLGPAAKEAVPALIEALKSEEGNDRMDVLQVLAQIGPAAREAIPAIRELALDESGNVRSTAAGALRRIGK